ncbi:MAG: hypothetical protein H0W78_10205 [Planctomycetes bacterium]|jgi:hypothetical protein|nr:hypothetical protein [Planctomycetota bacterium]
MIRDHLLPWLFGWHPVLGGSEGADPDALGRIFDALITVPGIVMLIAMMVVVVMSSRSRPVLTGLALLCMTSLVLASVVAGFEGMVFKHDEPLHHLGSLLFIVGAWFCSLLFLLTLFMVRRSHSLSWLEVVILTWGVLFWHLWSFAPLKVAGMLYWNLLGQSR